jgi:serine/threonine protein kinase
MYFIQILSAYQEMHRKGVLHRDIKMENVMIKNNAIKVIDFGFSKYVRPTKIESELIETSLGSGSYMGKMIFH